MIRKWYKNDRRMIKEENRNDKGMIKEYWDNGGKNNIQKLVKKKRTAQAMPIHKS